MSIKISKGERINKSRALLLGGAFLCMLCAANAARDEPGYVAQTQRNLLFHSRAAELRSAECFRVKPWYLGAIQTVGSLLRYSLLTLLASGKITVTQSGFLIGALFEVCEIGAFVADIVWAKSNWFNVITGNNSLGEAIALALFIYLRYTRRAESDKNGKGSSFSSDIPWRPSDIVALGILGVRVLLFAVYISILAFGIWPYIEIVAGILVLCIPIYAIIYYFDNRNRVLGDNVVDKISIGVGTVVAVLMFVLAAVVIENFGIAGWLLYNRTNINNGNGTINGMKINGDYWGSISNLFNCGTFDRWLRKPADVVIMLLQII